jgi:hypothetical protein
MKSTETEEEGILGRKSNVYQDPQGRRSRRSVYTGFNLGHVQRAETARRVRCPPPRLAGLPEGKDYPRDCVAGRGSGLLRLYWAVRSPNALIALGCAKISGRFEDIWKRRA